MPLSEAVRQELAKAKARLQAGFSYKHAVIPQIVLEDEVREERPAIPRRYHPPLNRYNPQAIDTLPSTEEEEVEEVCDEPLASALAIPKSIPNGCVAIEEVHEAFRSIFPYPHFNRAQSECFDTAYYSDDNMVVSAPTSTGKTVIMELAILRLILKTMGGNDTLQTRTRGAAKVVYMAPIKALCQQIASDWRGKLQPLGINCIELTGDSEDLDYGNLTRSDIILTTPEKWDSVTRKWKDNKKIVGQIALMLIDEVHLLNEDRGATLEAVVSRMNTVRTFESMGDCPSASLRFIALSATIPNIEDIGDWLNAPRSGIKTFGQEYRPVKVDVKVFGYPKCKNDYLFDNNLNFKLLDLIKTYSSGKPSLVFCSTRKSTVAAANEIAKGARAMNSLVNNEEQRNLLAQASQRTNDKALSECIRVGVGYHTAGMQHSDRALVEELFLAGALRALCATSTLAQGVNLPAHLVIIKSTQFYKSGYGFQDHNEMTVMQMIGRAGRPQFDTSAVAVIMTQAEHKQKWDNVLHGRQPIESNLMSHLIEHLNSEIVLRTITDVSVAVNWLKSTYLFKRIRKNPAHYGIAPNLNDEKLEKKLHEILLQSLTELAKYKFIEIDEDGFTVRPLEAGVCMARYYIEFATMKQFSEIAPDASLEELIKVVSKAKEFELIVLRQGEKKKLFEISNDPAFRFPLDGKIKSNDMKVCCLIQATLGNINIEEWGLKQEANLICTSANRLMRGMVHYLAERKYFSVLHSAVLLEKCFKQHMWENSNLMLKQLEKIGNVLAKNLASNGVDTFEKLAATPPHLIDRFTARRFPFGNDVKSSLASLPRYSLSVEQADDRYTILVIVSRLNEPKVSTFNCWHLIIGDSSNNVLFYKKLQTASTIEHREELCLPPPRNANHELVVLLINDEFIGLDSRVAFTPKYPPDPAEDDSWLEKAYYEYEATCQSTIPDFEDGATGGVITMTRPPPTPVATCKHTCKDKTKCKHDCCKGLSRSHKRKHTEDDVIDLRPKKVANSSKPLTEYFQPKPQQQSEQEQIVPDVSDDLDLDPSWFDDPVISTNTTGTNKPDEVYSFVGPEGISRIMHPQTTNQPLSSGNTTIQPPSKPNRIKLSSLKANSKPKLTIDNRADVQPNRKQNVPPSRTPNTTTTIHDNNNKPKISFVSKYLGQQSGITQPTKPLTPHTTRPQNFGTPSASPRTNHVNNSTPNPSWNRSSNLTPLPTMKNSPANLIQPARHIQSLNPTTRATTINQVHTQSSNSARNKTNNSSNSHPQASLSTRYLSSSDAAVPASDHSFKINKPQQVPSLPASSFKPSPIQAHDYYHPLSTTNKLLNNNYYYYPPSTLPAKQLYDSEVPIDYDEIERIAEFFENN